MVTTTTKWLIFCLLCAGSAFAQPNEHENARRQQRTALNRGNWIAKRVMSKDFMDKVGIEGEQAKKIKEALDALDKQSTQLDEEIEQAAAQQGEIAKKVLSEPGANVDEIMKIIERIGNKRTEQAKLATQRLVVMRDNLTAQQREKASAILNEDQKKWREERERNAAPNRPAAPKGW
jgi:hypothetical protein